MFRLETISTGMLDYYVDRRSAVIIDLREPEAYATAHIRTARNIPYTEDLDYSLFPVYGELILYCERGTVSLLVGRELAKKGRMVRSVIGGFHAYRGRNLVFSKHS